MIISVTDDGRGLDDKLLSQMAGKQQDAELDDQEALQLLADPGFSTKASVSKISGRGVGLEAVLIGIAELGGRLLLRREQTAGLSFELRFPFSLSLVSVLLAQVEGVDFAIPLAAVVKTEEYSQQLVEKVSYHDLYQLLYAEQQAKSQERPVVVIVQGQSGRVALGFDRLHDVAALSTRGFAPPLHRLRGLAGYAQLGGGLAYLLDLEELGV